MKKVIPYIITVLLFVQCTTPAEVPPKKYTNLSKETVSGTIYVGTIIEQTFVNKAGKPMENVKELYFRLSEEEIYFIKYLYSEGAITAEHLRPYLDKPITILGEIRDGLWDVSEDNPYGAQSRIGKYMVVFSIQ
jgi:hypothetical protein